MDDLQRLTAAADAVAANPLPLTDETAQEFLEAHPLESVFRYVRERARRFERAGGITRSRSATPRRLLSGSDVDKHAADVISSALGKILATSYGERCAPQGCRSRGAHAAQQHAALLLRARATAYQCSHGGAAD